VGRLAGWWNVSPVKRTALLGACFLVIAVIGDRFRLLHGQPWFVMAQLSAMVVLGTYKPRNKAQSA